MTVLQILKKNYEKLVLMFFLLVFVSALIYLILMVNKSRAINLDDLRLEKKTPDYTKINQENYIPSKTFEKVVLWVSAAPRKADEVFFTDIMNSYQAAPCPVCKAVIPVSDFSAKKCSHCRGALSPINEEDSPDKDSDSDGISDKKEIEYGMNPNDPSDVLFDMDDDGFSNLCEFTRGTLLNDAKNHPPFATRFYVEKIERKLLPFKVEKITQLGKEKKEWNIQTKEYDKRKKRMDDEFRKIGDIIDLDGVKYQIMDIIPKMVERFNPKIKQNEEIDKSEVILQSGDLPPVTVQIKEQVYENKETIFLKDSFSKNEFKVQLGEKFTVSDSKSKSEETYLIKKIVDRKTLNVELQMGDDPNATFNIVAAPILEMEKPKSPFEGASTSPKMPTSPPTAPLPPHRTRNMQNP
jgi:hypothetical protein